jgi:tetratricopeptide (TPR) repeat protein
MTDLAGICTQRGNYGAAESLLEQSLKLASTGNDPADLVSALVSIGILRRHQIRLPEALDWLRQAQRVSAEHGVAKVEAMILHNLGNVLADSGSMEDASRALQRALSLNEERGDIKALGSVHASMADLCFIKSDYVAAESHSREAVMLARKQGAPRALQRY